MNNSTNFEENGADQVIKIAKRRKMILILTPILVTILSGFLIFILPKEYTSSATILAKKTQTLNPLISYEMAVQLANQDQLNSINQIIYSRASVNLLIDSLDLAKEDTSIAEREALIKNVKKDIIIKIVRDNIFSIEYISRNPKKARKGVNLLINYFIDTDQNLRNEQNLETVNFFKSETSHIKRLLEETKVQRLSTIKKRVNFDPEGSFSLQAQLQTMKSGINSVSTNLNHYQQQYDMLDSLNNFINEDEGNLLSLMKLDLTNLPYGSNIQDLLQKYIDLKQTYTENYPSVRALHKQIADLADRIPSALDIKIQALKKQKEDLGKQRKHLISKIEKSSVAKGEDQSQADYYGVYQNLYNQMNVKLEQAEVNYRLGKKANERFVIIDPAIIPSKPSKPRRKLVLAGGLMIGIFLGLITAVAAEMLDTTIHEPDDLKLYGKPIIAFIPEGKH
ncbi:MAG TPA: GNVR domain-containing protein [Balneolales bacterium]|nr:GNVR domain-containing protein [Balneolales bacterium]